MDIRPSPIPLNLRTFLIVASVSAIYMLLSALLIGYKTDQLFLVALFNVLFWLSFWKMVRML